MNKMLDIDIGNCTGCHVCELMCSFHHHGEFNPRKARIHTTVLLHDEVAIPIVCSQCEDAWCERICPVGAISAGVLPESGARVLQVDAEKCVGCRMCALACPFGNIEVGALGYAEKCDLCGGDPLCVQFCPRGALRFGETVDIEAEKRDKWAKALADTYRESD